VIGTLGMIYWGRRSDRMRERKEHLALAVLIAGGGIAASTLLVDPTGKMIALAIAGFGIFAALPVFWTLPTAFLSGAAAAGGIAVINSIGNLAGFAGPYVVGSIKDSTGSYTVGLLIVAGVAFLAMLIALSLQHDTALEHPPEA
jgi:nitrate/nitrite transporter NarK